MVSHISLRSPSIACAILAFCSMPSAAHATQEEIIPELSQVGALIDFARDVEPILAAKCLKCHGPDEAKNDFRTDEEETLLSYVEPGDVDGSSLWSDYLITDDPDMRMPPSSVTVEEQLTGAELATIKLWIEEGGMWNAVAAEPIETTPLETLSMPERIWKFQGLFHPATTHFPIALLTVSAGFVLLSFLRPDTCEPVAFHCLWIGALGAIVASAAGWSYAVHEGYGAGYSFDLQNSAIDRHRWLGIGVAVLGLILIPVALYVRRTEDFGMRLIWLIGSVLLMGAVGTAGYQGGELTFGEGHYEQEFVKYFPDAFSAKETTESEVDETSHEVTEESPAAGDEDVTATAVSDDVKEGSTTEQATEETKSPVSDDLDGESSSAKPEPDTADVESQPQTAEPESNSAGSAEPTKETQTNPSVKL